MNAARLLSPFLRLDAAANVALAVGALVFREPLGAAGPVWPLLFGVLLLGNAALCWRAARPDTGIGMPRAAGVADLALAVLLGGVVAASWSGFAPALRWSLLGLADLSALVGVTKLVLTARASRSSALPSH
jgi:hypothetical protein